MSLGSVVTLRDVEDDDLPIFFEHQADPEACRMAAFPSRERDAFMEHWRMKVLGNPSGRARTIVVDGHVAGNVVSWQQGDQRLVGYWVGRDWWGRGIATAALSSFLGQETTRPLHAFVAAHNLGSIRVLEKCGFRRVGGSTTGSDGIEEHRFQLDA